MFFILTLSCFRPLDFSVSSSWLFLCPSEVLLCSISPYLEAALCFWSSLLSLLLLSPFSDVGIRAAFSMGIVFCFLITPKVVFDFLLELNTELTYEVF